MDVFVSGVAVRGPGLDGWLASRPILAGQAPYLSAELTAPPPAILPANERRRASFVTRLALGVAHEAVAMSGLPAHALRSVFGSANGDGATIHAVLDALSSPGRDVSPTQFHNTVHNAPAGYWSIGAGSGEPATCVGCHDATAAAALLKAAAEALTEHQPVLLCLYDGPMPAPLGSCRPIGCAFGIALVLDITRSASTLAQLRIDYRGDPPCADWVPRVAALGPLSQSNPAARLLPLLEALAFAERANMSIALLDGRVDVGVLPC